MLTLSTDIAQISRVGATTAKKLKKLGLETVQDLLFYWPFRYDDFSKITLIKDLLPDTSANVVGQIELIQNKRSPRKQMYITEALITDGTETVKVIWFNQPFIARNLRVGDKVSLAGKTEDDYGGIVMKSPAYEKITADYAGGRTNFKAVHTQGLVPNYHLTGNITQKQIRFLIKQVVALATQITDWLPEAAQKSAGLLDLSCAISKIHFPKSWDDINQARKRLAFNELFLIQMRSQLTRKDAEKYVAASVLFLKEETKKFVDSLPFKLTDAQRKAAWDILQDIKKDKPMSRILEGDVGSGKTVVAVIAMLNTVLNKGQSVLMVPTEILAKQHYEGICKLLAGFNIKVGLVTRSECKMNYELRTANQESEKERKNKIHNSIPKKSGQNSQIVIGTHALIQEGVEFKNLVLAIIDEQHRFGVEQRKTLIEISRTRHGVGRPIGRPTPYVPHLLSMTATPIPRSLALALYGDLDISIINEMPKNRKKIITQVVSEDKRGEAYDFIRSQIQDGRQVFVICPLIDFSDKLGVKSVKDEFKKLNEVIFPDIKIGIMHGKMKPKEKNKMMQDFLDNKIKILVSTSVVEVGVDVPNAVIMMIECAERFGLAQLHQFRGRVGRAEHQSYCFLFTESENEKTLKRLAALVNNYDGFALARLDLKFRGPGEVYGTAQKGFPELKIASLFDYALMKAAKEAAEKLVKEDASLEKWPELKEKVRESGKRVHLE